MRRLWALATAAALCLVLAGAPARAAAAADEPEQLFAIRYQPGPAWKPGRPMGEQGLLEHFHYWRALHKEGVVVMAGPVGATNGLVILRAPDEAEAARIMRDDPAVRTGVFIGAVEPFVPRFVGKPPATAPLR